MLINAANVICQRLGQLKRLQIEYDHGVPIADVVLTLDIDLTM